MANGLLEVDLPLTPSLMDMPTRVTNGYLSYVMLASGQRLT